MVDVGDRVLVESEKVGAVTRSGWWPTWTDGWSRCAGTRVDLDLRAERRLPAGHGPRAASGGGP